MFDEYEEGEGKKTLKRKEEEEQELEPIHTHTRLPDRFLNQSKHCQLDSISSEEILYQESEPMIVVGFDSDVVHPHWHCSTSQSYHLAH